MLTRQVLFDAATELFEAEFFSDAERVLELLVELHPSHSDGWELKGLAHRLQNDFLRCEHALRQAERLGKLQPIAQCAMADCLASAGRCDQARDRYLSAFDNPASGLTVLCSIADGFAYLGEWALCTTACLEWLKYEPRSPSAWFTLAVSVAHEGELQEFEALSHQAISLTTERAAAQLKFAVIADNLGWPATARELVDTIDRDAIDAIACPCLLQGLLEMFQGHGDTRAMWCRQRLHRYWQDQTKIDNQ